MVPAAAPVSPSAWDAAGGPGHFKSRCQEPLPGPSGPGVDLSPVQMFSLVSLKPHAASFGADSWQGRALIWD